MNPIFWVLWRMLGCTFVRYSIARDFHTGILYETPEGQQKIFAWISSYWVVEIHPYVEVIAQGRLKLKDKS